MKRVAILFLTFLCSVSLFAQTDFHEDEMITIWNNKTAPHSNGCKEQEIEAKPGKPINVTEAQLYIYKAKGKKSGQAVVICPGGGYGLLSMVEEGEMLGEWYAENGITAAVLKYRLPFGVKEVPFEDAERALEIVRENSAKWGIDPQKVGIMGGSAGGHLAAMISTKASEDKKPNFTVLFYPVIVGRVGDGHQQSFNRLLGEDRTEVETNSYSLEKQVTATTPPAIIFLCDDDKTVPPTNGTAYYNALKSQGIQASLHIYPEGKHGWGGTDRVPYQKEWQSSLLRWLKFIDE